MSPSAVNAHFGGASFFSKISETTADPDTAMLTMPV